MRSPLDVYRHCCALLAAVGLLACPLAAGADGGVWTDARTADEGRSADQQAILVYDAATATETLVITTKYQGAPSDFAWVIPVPSLPERGQVATCPEARAAFESLSQITAPRATEMHHGGGAGCAGCGVAGDGAGGSTAATVDVTVVERLAIDGLDISLLDAGAGGDLAAWLNGNGYRFPSEGTAIAQRYVDEGWKFVAVKVDVDKESVRQDEVWDAYFPQDPLRLTFHSDRMVFPMRISSLSTGTGEARVLLYVFADHRVDVTSYPSILAAAPGGISSAEQFPAAYESTFRSLIEQPTGRAFVLEYAQNVVAYGELVSAGVLSEGRTYFLTRLRTVLRAQDMAQDVVLADAETDTPFSIDVIPSSTAQVPGALLPVAAVTACFGARRRRGLPSRRAAKEALLLGLLLLGACFAV